MKEYYLNDLLISQRLDKGSTKAAYLFPHIARFDYCSNQEVIKCLHET